MSNTEDRTEYWKQQALRLERVLHEVIKTNEGLQKMLYKEKDDMAEGWIGVDLDGTLAEYTGWKGPDHIGKPIPAMAERVKTWIREGQKVKIMTARVCRDNEHRMNSFLIIRDWCLKHFGTTLDITSEKDYQMIELWDDRAVTVEVNTGRILTTESRDHKKHKL